MRRITTSVGAAALALACAATAFAGDVHVRAKRVDLLKGRDAVRSATATRSPARDERVVSGVVPNDVPDVEPATRGRDLVLRGLALHEVSILDELGSKPRFRRARVAVHRVTLAESLDHPLEADLARDGRRANVAHQRAAARDAEDR